MKRHRSFQDIRCSYFYLYREIRKQKHILTKLRNLEEGQKRLLKVKKVRTNYYHDLLSAVN